MHAEPDFALRLRSHGLASTAAGSFVSQIVMKELQLSPCIHFSISIPFDPSAALDEPIKSQVKPFDRGSWTLFHSPSRGGASRYSDYGLRWSNVDRRVAPIKLQLNVWASNDVLLAKNDLLQDRQSRFAVEQFPMDRTGKKEFLFADVPPDTILRLEGVVQGSLKKGERGSASSPCTAMQPWQGAFLDSHHPNDVRFRFKNHRTLWGNAELLKSQSPYFEGLLSSDFSEGKRITVAEMRKGGSPRSMTELFDDSDEEGSGSGDEATVESEGRLSCDSSFHSINISDTSYTTYRAVLWYLSTGHIHFKPSLRSSLSAQAKSCRIHLGETSSPSRSLPVFPSSPKSVYRLAHFLGLDDLCLLALQALRTSLTPDNILTELFSDISTAYPDVADVMLDAAADMWEQLKGGEAIKDMERKLEDGAIEVPVALLWKLMKILKGR